MGVPALAYRVQSLRWSDVATLAGAAAWGLAMLFALVGGGDLGSSLLAVLCVVAVTAGVAVLLRRHESTPVQRATVGGMVLATVAVAAALLISSAPLVAFVPPIVAPVAWACARHPAPALVAVFFFTGTFGSLTAFFSFPVGESVDLLLVGLWVGAVWGWLVSGRRRAAWLWPAVVLLGVYALATLLWVAFAEDMEFALRSYRASTWYLAAFLLIAFAPWPPGALVKVARGITGVACLVGGYALFRYIVGPAEDERALAIATSGVFNEIDGELRLVGSFPTGKELAGWSAITAPFTLAMALGWRGLVRWVGAAATLFAAIAIFGSDVRTALVALGACVAVVVVLFSLSRAFGGVRLAIAIGASTTLLVAGGGAFALTLGDQRTTEDRYTVLLTPEDDPAFQARLFKWRTAIADIDDAPLGKGVGTGGRIQSERGRFYSVAAQGLDSSYLKIAYEQGFFVMAFFIVALTSLLVGLAWKTTRTVDRARAVLGLGATGSLVSLMVLMFAGLYIEGLPALACWILVGLGVAGFTSGEAQAADERAAT